MVVGVVRSYGSMIDGLWRISFTNLMWRGPCSWLGTLQSIVIILAGFIWLVFLCQHISYLRWNWQLWPPSILALSNNYIVDPKKILYHSGSSNICRWSMVALNRQVVKISAVRAIERALRLTSWLKIWGVSTTVISSWQADTQSRKGIRTGLRNDLHLLN